MRERITTFGELFGAALFSTGVGTYSRPLGLMSAGLFIALFSWLAAR